MMTDQEALTFIRNNVRSTSKLYGQGDTLLAIYVPMNKDLEEWLEDKKKNRIYLTQSR